MRDNSGKKNWQAAARGLGLPVSAERIERAAPALDELAAACRAASDEDLSLVEPVGIFRPGRNARAKAGASRNRAGAAPSAAPRNASSD